MTTQLDLLADYPRARRSDPETSHEAAERIKSNGNLSRQQHAALALVRCHPGSTTWELAEYQSRERGENVFHAERWIGRRLGELEPIHISKGTPRIVRGRSAHAWWANR